jgi:hypothetical protein
MARELSHVHTQLRNHLLGSPLADSGHPFKSVNFLGERAAGHLYALVALGDPSGNAKNG